MPRTKSPSSSLPTMTFSGKSVDLSGMVINDFIYLSRIGLGWSPQRLADEAGVHVSTIHNREAGQFTGHWMTNMRIIEALGYRVGAIKVR